MSIEQWILQQKPEIQMEIWQRTAHFLSNQELMHIMQAVGEGRNLMEAHKNLGIFNKYQIDLLRVMEITKKRFPDDVIF